MAQGSKFAFPSLPPSGWLPLQAPPGWCRRCCGFGLCPPLALPRGPGDARTPLELDASALDYVSLVLRHQLHGRTFQDLGGLPGWLGTMVVGVRLAAAAAASDGTPVTARALGPRLATWVRLTRHATARRLLADVRPVLEDVAMHAGA